MAEPALVTESIPFGFGGALIDFTWPTAWDDRVRALLPKLQNGSGYDRAAVEYLPLVSRATVAGNFDSAAMYLAHAEHTMAKDCNAKVAELMGLLDG